MSKNIKIVIDIKKVNLGADDILSAFGIEDAAILSFCKRILLQEGDSMTASFMGIIGEKDGNAISAMACLFMQRLFKDTNARVEV